MELLTPFSDQQLKSSDILRVHSSVFAKQQSLKVLLNCVAELLIYTDPRDEMAHPTAQIMLSALPMLESGYKTAVTLTENPHTNVSLSSILGGLLKKVSFTPRLCRQEDYEIFCIIFKQTLIEPSDIRIL